MSSIPVKHAAPAVWNMDIHVCLLHQGKVVEQMYKAILSKRKGKLIIFSHIIKWGHCFIWECDHYDCIFQVGCLDPAILWPRHYDHVPTRHIVNFILFIYWLISSMFQFHLTKRWIGWNVGYGEYIDKKGIQEIKGSQEIKTFSKFQIFLFSWYTHMSIINHNHQSWSILNIELMCHMSKR